MGRAISIIQSGMARNIAFLYKKIDSRYMNNVIAAAFPSADEQKKVALVQSRQASDVCDREFPAPWAAAHASLSSDIVDVIKDLMDNAQTQLDDTPHAESNAAYNFALFGQSLEELTQDNKAITKANKSDFPHP